MTTIVTRAGKGSPLTNVEVDANFTNLNNDKLEKTGGTITANSSSAALTITQTGSGNAFVVEDQASDTTPFVIDSGGSVGVGTATSPGQNLRISKSITGSTISVGVLSDGAVQSDVTSQGRYFQSYAYTQAATFTTDIYHYLAEQGTFGAGSTVTNQYGFLVSSALTGATNNYGFYGNIPAGTGRYNFYAAGTAANYFAGDVGVGVAPAYFKLSVAQTAATHAVASLYNADATATYNTDLHINNGNVVGNALISRRTNGDLWMYTSAAHPIALWTNSAERMRIDASGNVLVNSPAGLGYGAGAGGTVTQATSKSTPVTLNKPTGQITMHNAALAAGASVVFVVNNSLVTTSDLVVVGGANAGVDPLNYRIETARANGNGAFAIRVTNISAGSLSEALQIQFSVIKGATS